MNSQSTAIDVQEAQGHSGRRAFVAFPYRHYRDDSRWVPPLRRLEHARLDERRNPFFAHADMTRFLALADGHVVGRVAAIDDARHREAHGDGMAAFGFFEAAGADVARALLARVESWARDRGRLRVRGPLSPSLNDMAGLLVRGFERPPSLMMPFNPPGYATWIEEAGYAKAKDLLAWTIELDGAGRLARLAPLVERIRARSGATVREINPARFADEIEAFSLVYEQAWSGNWGFVPPTAAERRYLIAQLRPVVDPRIVLCAEVQGQLAAFVVAVPDFNQVLTGTSGRLGPRLAWRFARRRSLINQGRVLLFGVRPEYRRLGLLPVLVHDLYQRGIALGYKRVECSWVLEDNAEMSGPITALGGVNDKTYRIFEKTL